MIKFTQKDKRKHWEVLNKLYKKIKKGEKGIRSKYGYSLCYYPEHPRSWKSNGCIPTHVIVVEYYQERFLDIGRRKNNEVVHHKNFKKLDNRYSNLEVRLHGEHSSFHDSLRLKERVKKESIKLAYRNKAWLYNEFCIKGNTRNAIAKKCGVTNFPIRERINKFGFKKKSKSVKK